MPACSSEIYTSGTRYRSSSPPNSRSNSASPPLSWPTGASPLSVSPTNAGGLFLRSGSNLSNSSLSHGKASFITSKISNGSSPANGNSENFRHRPWGRDFERRGSSGQVSRECDGRCDRVKSVFLPVRIIAWYVNLVLRFVRRLNETLSYLVWAPIIWISAWICVFWVIAQLPLSLMKWFIRALYTPSFERARNKRCVLITGGSTIQALHLARNFYKAGARVVVCEIDGLFGLARFSTACSRFYNVPRPGASTAAEYVNALKKIVEREKVVYFIPVSCTSSAYYDSLAKSHLEIMGCECFVPGTADVTSLEDPLQLMQRCASLGLGCPSYRLVRSLEDLVNLYEVGYFASNDRYVVTSAGPAGMTERAKLHLPASLDNSAPRNLQRKLEQYEISDRKPWLVIREPVTSGNGHQIVTCTTIKESRIVANVTCRLDETRGLVPEDRQDVTQWLDAFLRGFGSKRINGHLSFKLATGSDNSPGLLPISCRVGVPLPYLCFTSVHPRLVWRPCRHFSRQNSVNLIVNEKYKNSAPQCRRSASTDGLFASSTRLEAENNRQGDPGAVSPSAPVLDKMDALFVYWDPLPYCAYYHLQFPFRRLAGAIRERHAQHKPPLAVVK